MEKDYTYYIAFIEKGLMELKSQTQCDYRYHIRVSKKIMKIFTDKILWLKFSNESGEHTLFGEPISVEKSYTDDMISIQPVLFSMKRKEDYENRIEHVFFLQ